MNGEHRSRWSTLWRLLKCVFWAAVVVVILWQIWAPNRLNSARAALLERFQQERKSRVVAMIHREETVSLFGVPVSRYIDIDDSEAVLRAIRLTPPEQPLDLILHTPGGLVLAAEQIAHALKGRKGKITVFIPHYAMSGGTLIALTADEIVMDPNAVLGQVDPQIGDTPAASIVKLMDLKQPSQIGDDMLVLIDIAVKARIQVAAFVADVLQKRLPKDKAQALAVTLSEGRWTHDFPITAEDAKELGLPINTDMPHIIYDLMDLYPQAGIGRPSVYYVPMRPGPRGREDAPSAPTTPSPAKK